MGQLFNFVKSFAEIGYKLPEDVEPHVKLTNRSLEVWMTCLHWYGTRHDAGCQN